MRIGIVGLGLIGGSMARAIKQNTNHLVLGMDTDPNVVLRAKLFQAIDEELTESALGSCDALIIALHPVAAIGFLRENAAKFARDALVVDCCGIKRPVCEVAFPLSRQHGFHFIGGHPMAGIEKWGFEYSDAKLFARASMILVPPGDVPIAVLETAKKLFLQLGFGSVKISTPGEHDTIIAYTSQLAHVVSSAYIKSSTATEHTGFSAGSFRDMTRVATLSEKMWTELFLMNGDNLCREIDTLIAHLNEVRDAISAQDAHALSELLREGRERKALVLGEEERA